MQTFASKPLEDAALADERSTLKVRSHEEAASLLQVARFGDPDAKKAAVQALLRIGRKGKKPRKVFTEVAQRALKRSRWEK